jgi:hypothetical protein
VASISSPSSAVNSSTRPSKWKRHVLCSVANEKPDPSLEIGRGLLQVHSAANAMLCDDDATPLQKKFLRQLALPVLDSLERCFRRARILPEVPDEVTQ